MSTTSYTNPFGPDTLQVSDSSYQFVTLSANVQLVWPFATDDGSATSVSSIIDMMATADGFSLLLPPANAASLGYAIIFANRGGFNVTLRNYTTGATIGTVPAGTVKFLYLTDNSTADGVWQILQFGAIGSLLDAASLAGTGLRANASRLESASPTVLFSISTPITAANRASTIIFTGGTGSTDLPAVSDVGSNFYFAIRNQGTGLLRIGSSSTALIDGLSSINLSVGESAEVHCDGNNWYTVGRGRNQAFNFTLLAKAVTGGAVTLSVTEAQNIVQKYTGALTSNLIVTLPAVVQVYYVTNNTTGAFTTSFKTVGSGGQVIVPANQSVVLFCDGTNVTNANTAVAGLTALSLSQGSVTTPSISFTGDSTTGIFQPGGQSIGFTVAGTEQMRIINGGVAIRFPTTIAGSGNVLQVGAGPTAATPAYFMNVGDGNTGTPGNKFIQIGRNAAGDAAIDAYEGGVGAANMVFSGAGLEYGRFWAAAGTVQPRFTIGRANFGAASGVLNVNQSSETPLAGLVFTNRGTNAPSNTTYDIGGIYASGYRDVANPEWNAGIVFSRAPFAGGNSSVCDIVFKSGRNDTGSDTQSNGSGMLETARLNSLGQLTIGTGTNALPANAPRILANGPTGTDTLISVLTQNLGYLAMAVNASGATDTYGIPASACGIGTPNPLQMYFSISGIPRMLVDTSGSFYPAADNAYSLGAPSLRFSSVFAASGVVSTSDAREKHEVSDATLGLEFIRSLRPVSYKWITAGNRVLRGRGETDEPYSVPIPGKRTHWGFLAQEVKAAVDTAGVEFAGWTQDDPGNPESRQGLRYEEFVAPMVKAMQQMADHIERLEARIVAAGL